MFFVIKLGRQSFSFHEQFGMHPASTPGIPHSRKSGLKMRIPGPRSGQAAIMLPATFEIVVEFVGCRLLV